jgi:DNA-binding CsgD family transcriptional regulator
VKTHLLRSFGKLGVDDRTAAVTVAMQRGLLPTP